jgi:hypothetical protein
MKLHIDLLGRLHTMWGLFGVLAGASLAILAVGLWSALARTIAPDVAQNAAVWLLFAGAAFLGAGGAAMIAIGRALGRRRTSGRFAALVAAVLNLIVLPFGTALGCYTFWVLLNDDARREFGRPPRAALI